LAAQVGGNLLIILDQFEDYFLGLDQPDGEGTFAYEFQQMVNRPDLRVNFLISIREDAYSKLERFKDDISNVFDNSVEIGHLDARAAREAIIRPIEQYNRFYAAGNEQITLEPELVEKVLSQVRTGQVSIGDGTHREIAEIGRASDLEATIETPFLQLVMTALWKAELGKGSTVLRSETLDAVGGAQKIVATHLEQALEKLSESEKSLAVIAFGDLVTPSGDKRAYTAFDIAEAAESDREQLAALLEKLSRGNNRVLRSFASPGLKTESCYEIFHDVLAQPILDWRRQYRLDQRIKEAKRRADAELAEANRRAEEDRKLAAASARAEEQAKVAAILRMKNRALALATAAAVIAAAIAYWQYTRAEAARHEAVVAGNVHSDVLAKLYQVLLSPADAKAAARNLQETLDTLDQQRAYYQEEHVPIGEGITLNNKAGILREVGYSLSSSLLEWDKAQPYYDRAGETYQEAQAILEGALGRNHPDVATSLHDRAIVLMLTGDYAGAEPLFSRALSILESALGSNSRYVADAAVSLARCYDSQGKYGEAAMLYERAVSIRRQELRADHPDFAESLNELAWLRFEQGKYSEAEPLFRDALAIWQALPDPQHSYSVFSLEGLASISRERGKYKDAQDYLDQAQAAQGKLFEDNLISAKYGDNLALLQAAQNDPKAVSVALLAYQIRENGLGTSHPETAYSAAVLASCYFKIGNHADAEKYFNLALNTLKTLPSSPNLARVIFGLGSLYSGQGKFVEAEPLLKNALVIQEKEVPEHPDFAKTLEAYAELLDKTDRKPAAVQARSRADRILQAHRQKNPDN